jgi:hypothetical protein
MGKLFNEEDLLDDEISRENEREAMNEAYMWDLLSEEAESENDYERQAEADIWQQIEEENEKLVLVDKERRALFNKRLKIDRKKLRKLVTPALRRAV